LPAFGARNVQLNGGSVNTTSPASAPITKSESKLFAFNTITSINSPGTALAGIERVTDGIGSSVVVVLVVVVVRKAAVVVDTTRLVVRFFVALDDAEAVVRPDATNRD
jgi:hypothetical protein